MNERISGEVMKTHRTRNATALVLATAIAETSLTIPDIRTVVDSGLSRQPRFDPATGMTRLVTTSVSQASAEQRRGPSRRNDVEVE